MKNKRINLEERIEIYRLLDKDKNLRKIANFLKRSVSSISEEIKQRKDKYHFVNKILKKRKIY
ncbi:MAG: helix-turn-helix domain-containing protein [Candidatus Pacebacteria bacterium]|nr:helix-turn-helix domain-containing protein [Candidatus Paceibacterota bacterium]